MRHFDILGQPRDGITTFHSRKNMEILPKSEHLLKSLAVNPFALKTAKTLWSLWPF